MKWVLFCHNLFLSSIPGTSFAKVFTFDQLNMEMIKENWNVCSFGHKLINFVTICSWPPMEKLILQKFLHLINWIRKWYQKVKCVFIWSQIKSFCHNLFMTPNLKTYFAKVSQVGQINENMPSEKWNQCSFGHKRCNFVTTFSWPPTQKLLVQKCLHLINWIWK